MTRILKDWALTIFTASLISSFVLGGTAEETLPWKAYTFVLLLGNIAAPSFVVVSLFVLSIGRFGVKAFWLKALLAVSMAIVVAVTFFVGDLLFFQQTHETAQELFARDYAGWVTWVAIAVVSLPLHDWWANK